MIIICCIPFLIFGSFPILYLVFSSYYTFRYFTYLCPNIPFYQLFFINLNFLLSCVLSIYFFYFILFCSFLFFPFCILPLFLSLYSLSFSALFLWPVFFTFLFYLYFLLLRLRPPFFSPFPVSTATRVPARRTCAAPTGLSPAAVPFSKGLRLALSHSVSPAPRPRGVSPPV